MKRVWAISSLSPAGPYTLSGCSRSRSANDFSIPGSPSQWSAWKCVMNTHSTSASPTERSSWRCVPSPQSNSSLSPPWRTSTAGSPRRALGTDPPVPAKNMDISMPATVAAHPIRSPPTRLAPGPFDPQGARWGLLAAAKLRCAVTPSATASLRP